MFVVPTTEVTVSVMTTGQVVVWIVVTSQVVPSDHEPSDVFDPGDEPGGGSGCYLVLGDNFDNDLDPNGQPY